MYEIACNSCGRVGFHLSRVGAESIAERHVTETDHDCTVEPMEVA